MIGYNSKAELYQYVLVSVAWSKVKNERKCDEHNENDVKNKN